MGDWIAPGPGVTPQADTYPVTPSRSTGTQASVTAPASSAELRARAEAEGGLLTHQAFRFELDPTSQRTRHALASHVGARRFAYSSRRQRS